MGILLADDFLELVPPPRSEDDIDPMDSFPGCQAVRFFTIFVKLPMELQMLLSQRMFGSSADVVLCKHSEPAFRKLAALTTQQWGGKHHSYS